jgi:hypothetical protein
MRSLGSFKTEEEAKKIMAQYGEERVTILMPSKPGELYRVVLYQGLKQVKITVEETPIITHE